MVASAVCNEAILVLTIWSMYLAVKRAGKQDWPKNLRYFTVLSNLFCALAALLLLLCELGGHMPLWALMLKYAALCAVTVTFLTVLLFLWPSLKTYKGLWDGPELIMHLLTPALAALSYLGFEKRSLPFYAVFLGVLPVVLYGAVYLNRVVVAHRWNDLYGFNRRGQWKMSMAVMFLLGLVVALVLWAA